SARCSLRVEAGEPSQCLEFQGPRGRSCSGSRPTSSRISRRWPPPRPRGLERGTTPALSGDGGPDCEEKGKRAGCAIRMARVVHHHLRIFLALLLALVSLLPERAEAQPSWGDRTAG